MVSVPDFAVQAYPSLRLQEYPYLADRRVHPETRKGDAEDHETDASHDRTDRYAAVTVIAHTHNMTPVTAARPFRGRPSVCREGRTTARRTVTLLVVCVLASPTAAVGTASAAEVSAPRSVRAQIFATNNTAIISDPGDPRLKTRLVRFGRQVRELIRANGADPGRSTLLDGVFWSESLGQSTYERSREFDVTRVSPAGLHHIADVVRKTYHQESVLTFQYLPKAAPGANAVEVEVPGADVRRLGDGLAADPDARARLGGGSVTTTGRLVLVAARSDLGVVHRFVTEIGGTWSAATVRYGAEEFVEETSGQ
jgi:hypothetical protein